jgi:hypothetical protein
MELPLEGIKVIDFTGVQAGQEALYHRDPMQFRSEPRRLLR